MHPSRASRVIRGSLAATGATFFALVSHVTAGGQVPGWLGIAVPWVLSLAVCTVLAGRRLSLARLALAVGVSQFLFHTLFVLGALAPSASNAPPGRHAHAVMPAALTETAVPAHLHADAAMWMLHAAAAVLTVAVLYRGEAACRRVLRLAAQAARWVVRRVRAALPAVPALPAPSLGRAAAGAARPVTVLLAHVASRRGPPAPLAF